MFEENKRALLERAAAELGVSPLARLLNVPDGLLAAWLSGHAALPERELLTLPGLLEKLNDHREPETPRS